MDDLYIKEILDLINLEDIETAKEKILDYHPYEISEALLEFSEEQIEKFFDMMTFEELSDVFSYLEIEEVLEFFDDMKPKQIVGIIQALDIDDAVDVIKAIPEEERPGYLRLMKHENALLIKNLIKYKEDTAGSIMTTDFIQIDVKDNVEKAMKKLITQAVDAETINTIYVTDSKNILVGTLSLKEMILARKGQKIVDLMNSRIVSVVTSLDQEDVAGIFKDYDFTSLPVVDHLNRLLGIITIDDIVDVIDEEALEDYSRLAGISDVEIDAENETIWMSAKKRLPWLLILSILGFFTSTIIANFDDTLNAIPTIALFMPMILGMAGNTGTQSLAVTVRGLNNGEFENKSSIFRHLLRELGTGLLNGVLIGIILFGATYLFLTLSDNPDTLKITIVVSLSILASLSVSTLAGAVMPIVINSFKIDPAVASGPFVTMINDILALSVYFTLATILIFNTM